MKKSIVVLALCGLLALTVASCVEENVTPRQQDNGGGSGSEKPLPPPANPLDNGGGGGMVDPDQLDNGGGMPIDPLKKG